MVLTEIQQTFKFRIDYTRQILFKLALKCYLLLTLIYVLIDFRGIRYVFLVVLLLILLFPKLYVWFIKRKNNVVNKIIIDDECLTFIFESLKTPQLTRQRKDLSIEVYNNVVDFKCKTSNKKVATAYRLALENPSNWQDLVNSIAF